MNSSSINQSSSRDANSKRRCRRARWYQWAAVLLISVGLIGGYVLQSTQRPPNFYQELKAGLPHEVFENAKKFDNKIESLKTEAQQPSEEIHTIRFTQDEINAWLTHALPRRFPKSVPREVDEMLVHLQPEDSSIVLKIDSKLFQGFATATVDIDVGDQPNLLQIHLKKLYSGLVQIPIGRFRKNLVEGANRSGLPTDWPSDKLPALLQVDLNKAMTENLTRPTRIVAIRTGEAAIEIDYRFVNQPG